MTIMLISGLLSAGGGASGAFLSGPPLAGEKRTILAALKVVDPDAAARQLKVGSFSFFSERETSISWPIAWPADTSFSLLFFASGFEDVSSLGSAVATDAARVSAATTPAQRATCRMMIPRKQADEDEEFLPTRYAF